MEKKERLQSLDALRGFDMLFIMGGLQLVVAVAACFGYPDFNRTFNHIEWHGLHFMDTVFPLFLFMAGVSWPFSLASQVARGRTTGQIVRKVLLRFLTLFALGLMFYSDFFRLDPAKFRYDSVLCHIGFCWAVAAFLHMFVRNVRWRLAVCAALFAVHWALLYFLVAPDQPQILASADPITRKCVAAFTKYGTDGFSATGSIACWIDRTFMPGLLAGYIYDCDGLLSKLSGIVLASFGMLAGTVLRSGLTDSGKLKRLLAFAAAAVILCCAWWPWCPINKRLWTPSFVLLLGAYGFAMLALFYWLMDVKGWTRWAFFFKVIGMNSITIYLAQRVVDFRRVSEFFLSGVAGMMPGTWGGVVLAGGYIAACWLFLLFLYRKNTFLKV